MAIFKAKQSLVGPLVLDLEISAEHRQRHVINAPPVMSEEEWLATYAPKTLG